MIRYMKATLLIIFAISLLNACSPSLKEEQKEIQSAVANGMKKKPSEPNSKNEDIEFKIPFGFEIEKETPNNIILKNGSKTYILFYNQQEDPLSDVVYKSTLQQKEKFDVNETFKTKEKFGYLLIDHLSKKENEMTIGIGGVKLTTEAQTAVLSSEATTMIEIVNSVKLK